MVAFVRSTIEQGGDCYRFISATPIGNADVLKIGLVTTGCPIGVDPMSRDFEGAYMIFEVVGDVVMLHTWDSDSDDPVSEEVVTDYDGTEKIKMWLSLDESDEYNYLDYFVGNGTVDTDDIMYVDAPTGHEWRVWGASEGNESGWHVDFEALEATESDLTIWDLSYVGWNAEWEAVPEEPVVPVNDDYMTILTDGDLDLEIVGSFGGLIYSNDLETWHVSSPTIAYNGPKVYLHVLDWIGGLTVKGDGFAGIDQWWEYGCNLRLGAGSSRNFTVPNVSPPNVTNMQWMFYNAIGFNQDISNWDTSAVTNMSYMFGSSWGSMTFNQDISGWNVSNVTNMASMFSGCETFNSDISNWDVSNVTDMSNMFGGTYLFNRDISGWDTSNVTNMRGMLGAAKVFNQPIGDWDVSSVTDMRAMFRNAHAFNGDISGWDTSNVTDMVGMFQSAVAFGQNIGDWDVSNVTGMNSMFSDAYNFNGHIGDWDVSNVTDMTSMFSMSPVGGVSVFNQDLSGWCVSKIPQQQYNFDFNASAWTLPRPIWGTCPGHEEEGSSEVSPEIMVMTVTGPVMASVVGSHTEWSMDMINWSVLTGPNAGFGPSGTVPPTKLYIRSAPNDHTPQFSMLSSGQHSVNIANFKGVDQWWNSATSVKLRISNNAFYVPDISPVNMTDFSLMFSSATLFNQDLSNWDVSNVTDMTSMFSGASSFNQDLSGWDVSNVTSMEYMFQNAIAFDGDISDWDTSNVRNMRAMFNGASVFNQDLSGWDVGAVTIMTQMFRNAVLFNQDLSNWCVPSYAITPTNFATGTTAWVLPRPNWGTCPATHPLADLHSNIMEATVSGPLTVGFTSSFEYSQDGYRWMLSASGNNVALPTVAGKVYIRGGTMDGTGQFVFSPYNGTNRNTLVSVDKWWDRRNPIAVQGAGAFTVPDTAPINVDNMRSMFRGATLFNQDLSNWDVSKVEVMNQLFYYATAFNGDIAGWDVSNVTNMEEMFRGAESFNQDISGWDVSNVTDMTSMFYEAKTFNADLSGWCVTNILSQPNNFDYFTPIWTAPRPIWGTCPDNRPFSTMIMTTTGPLRVEGFEEFEWSLDNVNWTHSPGYGVFGPETVGEPQQVFVRAVLGEITKNFMFQTDYVGNTNNFRGIDQWWEGNSRVVLSIPNNSFYVPDHIPVGMTNINAMFEDATGFNQDISVWDVSHVTTMNYVFNRATSFNRNLNSWDVSNVTSMLGMFAGASNFNQSLNSWDVSNVKNMGSMFRDATRFNGDISGWDVSNVTDMKQMFDGARAFNQVISNWSTGNVTNMQTMFRNVKAFNQNLSGWCVSKIPFLPVNFDTGASVWTLPKPIWGTCPNG